jgi:hypothetical protein
MRLIRWSVVVLATTITLLFATSAASADPIARPWSGRGVLHMDWGLGGTDCTAFTVAGARTGNTISSADFGGCSGALSVSWAYVPWSIGWNATNTGGTVAFRFGTRLLGLTDCDYAGQVPFVFDPTARTLTLYGATARTSGSTLVCATTVDIEVVIAL